MRSMVAAFESSCLYNVAHGNKPNKRANILFGPRGFFFVETHFKLSTSPPPAKFEKKLCSNVSLNRKVRREVDDEVFWKVELAFIHGRNIIAQRSRSPPDPTPTSMAGRRNKGDAPPPFM